MLEKLQQSALRGQLYVAQAFEMGESEEGSTTVEYAIGAIATVLILMRVSDHVDTPGSVA